MSSNYRQRCFFPHNIYHLNSVLYEYIVKWEHFRGAQLWLNVAYLHTRSLPPAAAEYEVYSNATRALRRMCAI